MAWKDSLPELSRVPELQVLLPSSWKGREGRAGADGRSFPWMTLNTVLCFLKRPEGFMQEEPEHFWGRLSQKSPQSKV